MNNLKNIIKDPIKYFYIPDVSVNINNKIWENVMREVVKKEWLSCSSPIVGRSMKIIKNKGRK